MQEDIVKITGAVYKILEFFSDNDPLKTKTKEKALAILEAATAVFESRGQVASSLKEDISLIQQYLKLAQLEGWIDGVNALIIIKHYQDLKNSLPKAEQKPVVQAVVQKPVPVVESAVAKGFGVTKKPAPKAVVVGKTYTERQKKILHILNKKGKAQVADLLKEIPDITKRTLRRDMDDLLKKGSAVRVGQFNQVFYKVAV